MFLHHYARRRSISLSGFAPRHLIIAVPFILATMCLPFTVKSNIVFYCTCGALLVGFLIPWGLTSEKSINHLSFAPKISIGIKEAVVSASRQHTHIYLDTNDQNRTSASFYTFTYFEDQSLWYIERDTKTAPLRLTAGHLCEASRDARNFIISFRNLPCLRGKTNAAVLKIHILDLPG